MIFILFVSSSYQAVSSFLTTPSAHYRLFSVMQITRQLYRFIMYKHYKMDCCLGVVWCVAGKPWRCGLQWTASTKLSRMTNADISALSHLSCWVLHI